MNVAPAGFTLERDLGKGFTEFFLPLHKRFTPEQRRLVQARKERLVRAHRGELPSYLPPSEATSASWRIELPPWRADWPGVMFDLENSMVNTWEHLMRGHRNVLAALHGERASEPSEGAVWTRVRGLHLSQAGIIAHAPASASLFDLALLVFRIDGERLRRPLCICIPKSESAEEALWWKAVFDALVEAKGWRRDSIKAIALIESHPIAYEMEEFLFNLREYVLGLTLGRRDYLASVMHYTLPDRAWLMPDCDTIPCDVPFLERVRMLMAELTAKHGALAIGGEPAHSDDLHPDLRPAPVGAGAATLDGTHHAIRTAIRYRSGVLDGRGASSIDGHMEDLATDRLCRLTIAQRLRHPGEYTPRSLTDAFDEELERVVGELGPATSDATRSRYRKAREISEAMILSGTFDGT